MKDSDDRGSENSSHRLRVSAGSMLTGDTSGSIGWASQGIERFGIRDLVGVFDQIPGRIDRWIACLHEFIDHQSTRVADVQAGIDGQLRTRANPDSENHQIGWQRRSVAQDCRVDATVLAFELQDALTFDGVDIFSPQEIARHFPKDRIESVKDRWGAFDQVDLDADPMKLFDDLDPNETCSDDQGSSDFGFLDLLENPVHIGKGPKLENVGGWILGKRGQHRLRSHSQDEFIVGDLGEGPGRIRVIADGKRLRFAFDRDDFLKGSDSNSESIPKQFGCRDEKLVPIGDFAT